MTQTADTKINGRRFISVALACAIVAGAALAQDVPKSQNAPPTDPQIHAKTQAEIDRALKDANVQAEIKDSMNGVREDIAEAMKEMHREFASMNFEQLKGLSNASDQSVKTPAIRTHIPSNHIHVPSINVRVPAIHVHVPAMHVRKDGRDVDIPEIKIDLPEIKVDVPDIHIDVPEINVDVPPFQVKKDKG